MQHMIVLAHVTRLPALFAIRWVTLGTAAVTPLAAQPTLDALRFTSTLGVIFVA